METLLRYIIGESCWRFLNLTIWAAAIWRLDPPPSSDIILKDGKLLNINVFEPEYLDINVLDKHGSL